MITVTFWASKEQSPAITEIPEGRDPFEICELAARRLDLHPLERDEKFERIMLARASAPQEPDPQAATQVERQPKELPVRAGVRDASMEAYRHLTASGKLTAQQRRVYELFCSNPERRWTRSEIAEAIKMRINSCTGRVNEMLAEPLGVLEECGRRRCTITGENVNELRLR